MTEINKEYAAALFELAKEQHSEKEFFDALHMILSEFSAHPDYLLLLSSPNIPLPERIALLDEAFAARVPEYVLSFTALLCQKGHIQEFSQCVASYEELYKAFQAISNARIVSAVPLTEAEKSALLEKLKKISGHSVFAQYETDETLLGGVTIYMDGKIMDGSLKHRLNEIKDVIGK